MATGKPAQTWSKLSDKTRTRLRSQGVERGLTEKQVRDRYNRGTLTRSAAREKARGSEGGREQFEKFSRAQDAAYLQQRLNKGEELTPEEMQRYEEGKEDWYH